MQHKLKTPIPGLQPGVMHTVLTVRDHLTVGDMLTGRRAGDDALLQDQVVIACLCGLDPKEAASLDWADFKVLQQHMARLLAGDDADDADPKA